MCASAPLCSARGPETASMKLPDATRRLFPDLVEDGTGGFDTGGFDTGDFDTGDFVIGRLLEDGDRDDLRWLAASTGREKLADWLRRRGERQLSSRSRAFWSLVLDVDLAQRDDALWPL